MSALWRRDFPRTVVDGLPGAYAPAFSPDSSMVATASHEGSGFAVYSSTSGETLGQAMITDDGETDMLGVEFHPDPRVRQIVTRGSIPAWDGGATVQGVWDWASGRRVGEATKFSSFAHIASFSPGDGSFMLSGSNSCDLRLLDAQSGEQIWKRKLDGWGLLSAEMSSDGRWVAAVGARGSSSFTARILKAGDGEDRENCWSTIASSCRSGSIPKDPA